MRNKVCSWAAPPSESSAQNERKGKEMVQAWKNVWSIVIVALDIKRDSIQCRRKKEQRKKKFGVRLTSAPLVSPT
jgi:DNA-binding transcriptional regulator PaaX